MKNNFEPALAAVLVHEGAKDDDPRDPGGRTAYGVVQRRYNQYRKAKGLPVRDVWLITPQEREDIYRTYYWQAVRADELPAGLDYVVFDGAVNSGEAQAGKWLQRALNDIGAKSGAGPILVDGRIGDGTIQAANAIEDVDAVIGALQTRRLAMLRNLKTWKYYGKGWGRRVEDVRKLGQGVAMGSVALKAPPGWVVAPGKALITDAKPLPSAAGGVVTSALGTATSLAGDVSGALSPLQGISAWGDTLIQGVTVVGVAATVIGIAWVALANARSRQMAAALDIDAPPAAELPRAVPAVG